MPREADYKIVWSVTRKEYDIVHTPFGFPLTNDATLQHWLWMVTTVSFCSATGHTCTLRKEAKQRGGGYWYAYKRTGQTVHKRYLGTAPNITLALLEEVARRFVEPGASPHVASKPPPTPQQRKPTLPPFTKSLDSALRIYGFVSIPTKRDLLTRYRELSKRHHPDTGGMHEDMVTVNLAYDYLKKFVR